MNSYQQTIGKINKLYFDKTTMVPPDARTYENDLELNWNNQLAIHRVYQVSELLGRNPDVIGKEPGQSVIWYNPKTKIGIGQYHKFEIQDQAYQHTKPDRHADFFFVWFRMKMKPEKIADINKITNSSFYYGPGELVCSSCHFLEASIASFSVLKDYNDCRINLEEAIHLYDTRIKELLEEFLESEKSDDIKNFHTPLRDILESYIVSDMPPEEVFESYDKNMLLEVPLKTISASKLQQIEGSELDVIFQLTTDRSENAGCEILEDGIESEPLSPDLPRLPPSIADNQALSPEPFRLSGTNRSNRPNRLPSGTHIMSSQFSRRDVYSRLPSGTTIVSSDNNLTGRISSIPDESNINKSSHDLLSDYSMENIQSESKLSQFSDMDDIPRNFSISEGPYQNNITGKPLSSLAPRLAK